MSKHGVLLCAVAVLVAGACAPARAGSATPAPCSTASPISATVAYHFSGPRLESASGACSLPLLNTITNQPDASADVALALTADGLTVTFDLAQPQVRAERSVFRNDNIEVFVTRFSAGVRERVFSVTVDPNGRCTSISTAVRFLGTHDQCSAQVTDSWSPVHQRWTGSVSIGYAALDSVLNGTRAFAAGIRRTTWTPGVKTPVVARSAPAPVAFATVDRTIANLWPDRYATIGADIGRPVDVPPHRLVANAVVPLDGTNLVTATFADDAGKVLSIRNKAAKGILDANQAVSFRCRSCGSFSSTYTQPFDLALTSAGTLGVDLSSLGVDTAPFSLDTISYPIDSGYKLVHTGDAMLAAAVFNGTTGANGAARDGVVQYQNAFAWKNETRLQLDVFHAVATRSEPGPAPAGTYPALDPIATGSVNTQVSAALSGSRAVSIPGDPAASIGTETTYSALVRYGTQYAGSSQTLDVAFSKLRDPAVFDINTVYGDKLHVGYALGYRSVGTAYAPLDADYDLHSGQRGLYGVVEVTAPVCNHGVSACSLRTQPFDAKITAYRFGDAAQARDVSAGASLTYPFYDTFSLTASYATAAVTVSQAGRANDIAVSDAQGGRRFLPNGQYSAALSYTANTGPASFFEASAGYTQAQAQGCNPSALQAPPPCYAFRAPSLTGSLYWRPFRMYSDFFVNASLENSTSQPFDTGTAALTATDQSFFATTASHIVRTAAAGAHLFTFKPGGCSTLLLTTSNRGGSADHFASSPPKPGQTTTASLELVPAGGWPTVLAAYSRVVNRDAAATPESLFVVRVQYGILPHAFAAATARSCGGG